MSQKTGLTGVHDSWIFHSVITRPSFNHRASCDGITPSQDSKSSHGNKVWGSMAQSLIPTPLSLAPLLRLHLWTLTLFGSHRHNCKVVSLYLAQGWESCLNDQRCNSVWLVFIFVSHRSRIWPCRHQLYHDHQRPFLRRHRGWSIVT